MPISPVNPDMELKKIKEDIIKYRNQLISLRVIYNVNARLGKLPVNGKLIFKSQKERAKYYYYYNILKNEFYSEKSILSLVNKANTMTTFTLGAGQIIYVVRRTLEYEDIGGIKYGLQEITKKV